MEREDGEMSDDNAMVVDDDTTEIKLIPKEETTTLYSTEKFGIVVKELEKADTSKLEERAKRFGSTLTGNKVITQKQIDELYEHFGIESRNERHFRLDTIHINGAGGMTTNDIFKYLEAYKPVSLEWIDNISCNVVCQDHISAALALLAHSREIEDKDLKLMLAEKSNYHWREGLPFKENLILMRFATNGEKKIVKNKSDIRKDYKYFNNNLDMVTKNPWGDLCKSWGVYDHQEVFHRKVTKDLDDYTEDSQKYNPIKNNRLAMRLGKRNYESCDFNISDDSSSDTEWKRKSKTPRMRMHADDEETNKSEDSNSDPEWKRKSKVPRMRMRADDEETKQKTKLIGKVPKEEFSDKYAPLSIEIINSSDNYKQRTSIKLSDKFKYHNIKEQKFGIHSRLGEKFVTTVDNCSSDDSESSKHPDFNIMSKVQKVSNKSNASGIWSRLEVTHGNKNVESDLRNIIKSKNKKNSSKLSDRLGTDDLRDRLGKIKKSNLRIEIDNSS